MARRLASADTNAHEGYVSSEKAETIPKMVSSDVPTRRHHEAPAGLLRCRRCGRKLTLRHLGTQHDIPRYSGSPALPDFFTLDFAALGWPRPIRKRSCYREFPLKTRHFLKFVISPYRDVR